MDNLEPWSDRAAFIAATLAEDLGDAGDITSAAVIPAKARFAGVMVSRDAITVAGLFLAASFFRALDPDVVRARRAASDADALAAANRAVVRGAERDREIEIRALEDFDVATGPRAE